MIAAWLCFAAISPHRTGAFAEGGETTQARRAPDERAALIEAALFTRGEFFGAQALIPYPTAEARSRLAEVQNKYPEDPAIYSRLAQLDEKLGHQEQALNELRRAVELERESAEALEQLAAFHHRQARFADEAKTLERMIHTAAPAGRAGILERLMELARIHNLADYLRPDFYRQLIASDPTVFEIVRKFIDRLLEQTRYDEALRTLRQYRGHFPDHQLYFLEKEADVLVSLGRGREAEGLYVKAFDPFWPRETADNFYQFLSHRERLRAYGRELKAAFRRHPESYDLAVRLFHYVKREDGEAAGILIQLEKARARRGAARWQPDELATVARLLIAEGEMELASRFLYTLYAQGGLRPGSELRAAVLYQLFKLVQDARYETTALTAGDLKLYEEVAAADPHPGLLGGVLSLVLADSNPQKEFEREQEIAVKYFNRAAAYRIFTAYKQESPTSPELAQMYLDIVRLYSITGEADIAAETLAEFEKRYGDAPQFAEVALKLADAYIHRGDFEKERALYQRMLDHLGQKRAAGARLLPHAADRDTGDYSGQYNSIPAISEPAELKPALIDYPPASSPGIHIEDDGDEVRGVGRMSRYDRDDAGWRQSGTVTYAAVLERYVASLAKENRTADVLALYTGEIKKYPDEQGLYEQMLQWLGQTNLVAEQLRIYREALKQFPTALWSDRLARWFVRRERSQEFESFSRELLEKLNDQEIQIYLGKFIQRGASAAASNFDASLYLGLHRLAHERFPHNLSFVEGLLRYYSGHNQWQQWQSLVAEYYLESPQIREQFLAHLAGRNELHSHLDRAQEVIGTNQQDAAALTAYRLFCADAAVWLSRYEEAIDAYRELDRLYPNTPEYAERLIAFTRSFGQRDAAFLEQAATAQHALADAVPSSDVYRTQAGEIYAEMGAYRRAKSEWQQLLKLGRGEPETYLQTATVYWDYFQYAEALETITALRRQMKDQSLYAFQAGAIYEARHQMRQALAEYAKGLDEDAPEHGRAMRRLRTLYARRGMPEQIRSAFSQALSRSREQGPLVIGYVELLRSVGQWKAAAPLLRREAARGRDQDFLDRARHIFEAEEDDDGVLATLRRAALAAKNDRFAISYRLRLATAYASRGRRGVATSALDDLVRKYPANYGVLGETADLYWRLGRRESAIRVLAQGARLGRGKFHYIFARRLAAKETERGHLAAAERVLRPLYEEDKFNLSVFHALSRIYVRTSKREALKEIFREALDAIRNADLERAEMRQQIAALRGQMIEAFTQLGDYRAAMEQHLEIINRNTDDETRLTAAIEYARRYGGADELLAYYQRTSQQAYKDYRWNLVLARIYEAKGDFTSAAGQYRQGLINQPEMVELHGALAGVYLRLKDYNHALESLDQARKLSNDDPQYIRRIADALDQAGRHREAEVMRQKLPAEPKQTRSTGEQFAEAARLRATDRAKAVAAYREAFNLFASDIYNHELKAFELAAYVQTVRSEESLDAILNRLWELRERVRREAGRGDNLQAGKARSLLETFDRALPDAVGGVAAESATGDELEAVCQSLARWADEAIRGRDERGTLTVLRNLSERAGFGLLGEKIAVAQKDVAFAAGDRSLYHARLRALVSFYDERGAYQHAVDLLEAEAARDRSRGEFDYPRLIAEHARLLGDREKELRTLRAYYRALSGSLTSNTDPLVGRYFEALLESGEAGRDELRLCAGQPSPYHFQLINFLLARGERELAREAVAQAPLSAAWKQARSAEISFALRDFDPERENDFVSALHWQTVGEMIGRKPDQAQQLIGDDWFRLAASYGRWLSASKRAAKPFGGKETSPGRAFLPALVENRPQDAGEQWRLGRWYLEHGEARLALEHLGFALEIKPDDKNILADLGSALFLTGDQSRAKETWTRIIAGDDPTPKDYETWLNVLLKHALAAEARNKLTAVVISRLRLISRAEGRYGRETNEDFKALKPLVRALAVSFGQKERGPGQVGSLASPAGLAKAAFFHKICVAVAGDRLLPGMLLNESIIHESERGQFYRLLVGRSDGFESYQRNADFVDRLRNFWGSAEAEEALDHERDFKGEELRSEKLDWQKEYLDYLVARGKTSEALATIAAIEQSLKGRYPRPAWLRLARSRLELRAGRDPHVLRDLRHFAGIETAPRLKLIRQPNLERLNQAMAMLRSEGRTADAQALLDAAAGRMIALEQYKHSSFINLAESAFEHGQTAQGLKLLQLLVRLGGDETRAAAEAELAAFPWVKARAVDDPMIEKPEAHNGIQPAEALRLASETAAAFGQLDVAIDYCRQRLSLNPEDESGRIELARLLAASGKDDEATSALASVIGDRLATRRLRWTAVWLAPEIAGTRSELWEALEQRVRAANAKDAEMNAALGAVRLSHEGRNNEAIKLISTAIAGNPNAQLICLRALLEQRNGQPGEALRGSVEALIANPEAKAFAAFGLTEDEPRWQLIRLYASLGKPRAALQAAEADVRLKRKGKGEAENSQAGEPGPEDRKNTLQPRSGYQSLQARATRRQSKSLPELLELLSIAAEHIADFDRAADFERARLDWLPKADDQRRAEQRIEKLTAQHRERGGKKAPALVIDQRPVAGQ